MKKTIAVMAIFVAAFLYWQQTSNNLNNSSTSSVNTPSKGSDTKKVAKNIPTVTNRASTVISRPLPAPVKSITASEEATLQKLKKEDLRHQRYATEGYGEAPSINSDEMTAEQLSTLNAVKSAKSPELYNIRASVPFDKKDFLKNPQAYTSVASPSRAYQTAPADSNAPHIKSETPYYQQTEQGVAVPISITAIEGMPVSLVASDGGIFPDSGLNAISRIAGPDGKVTVDYLPTSGVIEDVTIIAGSPATRGTKRFVVNVRLPEKDITENKE